MAKFWKVLKVIIFSVGVLTLALIAYLLIITWVPQLFQSSKDRNTAAPAEEVVFEKKDGGMKLALKRREADGAPEYLLSLSRDGSSIVQKYHLPTKKYQIEYVDFYDASIVPGGANEYRRPTVSELSSYSPENTPGCSAWLPIEAKSRSEPPR